MIVKEEFKKFLENLKIKNRSDISTSYKGVTKKLNDVIYDLNSDTLNSLQIGSFGRNTAIHGISDLDMMFILPDDLYSRYDKYKGNGQRALLQFIKNSLKDKYKESDIYVDSPVVVFKHSKYRIEVLPTFKKDDGSYIYPDTGKDDKGSWKQTKPKEEIAAISDLDKVSGGVLKDLCKMTRAWKNKVGAPLGGLLIDTLCYDFIQDNAEFNNIGLDKYDSLILEFFKYLSGLDKDRVYWYAPGSNQQVYKKGNFVSKAKKAFKNIEKAIEKEGKEISRKYWKKVFGFQFPAKDKTRDEVALSERGFSFRDTEEFIENIYPVDINEAVTLECKVSQDGFRTGLLSKIRILKNKFDLEFFVGSTTVQKPYEVYWKVKNIGPVAEKRDCIRGQIVKDEGYSKKKENSSFDGDHYVECYIVKDGVVLARDDIDVMISGLVE